ncbi:glutathione S-transferase family protein [Zavarzinia sp. CC-PAN008]|uniref:glutathione S-transferase family protein n=1 Tax=Zavarzinia sp. CC-PAN008 TaxID=3243332 RepID=UPI003F7467A3
MSLSLFAHPLSSYCQKVTIGLYENAIPFAWRQLGAGDDAAATEAEWAARWPMKRMPVLVDGARTVVEATIILEYLDLHHPGPVRLLPTDPRAALEVRFLDRFFDNYIQTPQQRCVFDVLRPEGERDARGVAEARAQLEQAYAWLENRLEGCDGWLAGDFSLADCAAAPALFYAHWTVPIAPRFGRLLAYRRRLMDRPSFARAIDEARPYRQFFPLGVPAED